MGRLVRRWMRGREATGVEEAEAKGATQWLEELQGDL